LTWCLALFQIFCAANYLQGWVLPVRIPFPSHPVQLFSARPPSSEDWHIADILREAEGRADPRWSVANMTLVANASYFNGPNFTWMRKQLGLEKIRLRGVN